MPSRAENLYAALQFASAVLDLIGQAEDAHLDCKEWPSKEDDAQKMLAKAACGLANADGGVLVIGMKAESRPKDEPDVVTSPAPVENTSLVKSRVLSLISNLVEPGIVGVEIAEIPETIGAASGFVVVYVPKTGSTPHRSRKDWKFYQRIGSATLPMNYWQIEALFGKRPAPKLEFYIVTAEMLAAQSDHRVPLRVVLFGLRNEGLGIARFPGVRFRSLPTLSDNGFGIDGNCGYGLPLRPSVRDWIVYRGGVDDVIYPGESRPIATLRQLSEDKGEFIRDGHVSHFVGAHVPLERRFFCASLTLLGEISAEGVPTRTIEHTLLDASFTKDVPRPTQLAQRFGRQNG